MTWNEWWMHKVELEFVWKFGWMYALIELCIWGLYLVHEWSDAYVYLMICFSRIKRRICAKCESYELTSKGYVEIMLYSCFEWNLLTVESWSISMWKYVYVNVYVYCLEDHVNCTCRTIRVWETQGIIIMTYHS